MTKPHIRKVDGKWEFLPHGDTESLYNQCAWTYCKKMNDKKYCYKQGFLKEMNDRKMIEGLINFLKKLKSS